jgi:hypothetical protein
MIVMCAHWNNIVPLALSRYPFITFPSETNITPPGDPMMNAELAKKKSMAKTY